ncbi:MAG TPA: hypothetical protein VFV38_39570 [Ktedonobacteraceae bacterium]|nr:hypothetical protein [Ktedonobacteraceae bacterium]
MTQTQERETVPATERAQHIINEAGERLGMWTGKMVWRMRQAAGSVNAKADQMEGTEAKPGQNGQKVSPFQPNVERAEELVDRAGQYITHWAQVSNIQIRRTMARLRENAEDIWVEAQEVQRQRQRPR